MHACKGPCRFGTCLTGRGDRDPQWSVHKKCTILSRLMTVTFVVVTILAVGNGQWAWGVIGVATKLLKIERLAIMGDGRNAISKARAGSVRPFIVSSFGQWNADKVYWQVCPSHRMSTPSLAW